MVVLRPDHVGGWIGMECDYFQSCHGHFSRVTCIQNRFQAQIFVIMLAFGVSAEVDRASLHSVDAGGPFLSHSSVYLPVS